MAINVGAILIARGLRMIYKKMYGQGTTSAQKRKTIGEKYEKNKRNDNKFYKWLLYGAS